MQEKQHPTGCEIIIAGLDGIKFLYRCHAQLGLEWVIHLSRKDMEISGVLIEGENISTDDAHVVLYNSIQSAICCLWIAIDEALDAVFGSKITMHHLSTTDDFRAVIYMFRCAFAHGISQPKWTVLKDKYRREICLPIQKNLQFKNITEFKFDFTKCSGQSVRNEDYGHLPGLIALSQMACEMIEAHTSTTMVSKKD